VFSIFRWGSVLGICILPLTAHRSPLAGQQPSPATRVARAAEADVIRGHLTYLADDALEGRAPGTRGGDLAAKYVAAQFARLGLVPAGDDSTYFHRVPIISLDPSPQASIVSGGDEWALEYRKEYVMWSMHDDSLVSTGGDLVFVGYGIIAPEYGWNDYEGVDVKGKVVVSLVNTPGIRDSTLFRGRYMTYYGRWTYKLEEAERQGAAGILLVHTPESATYGWATVTGSWSGPQTRVERKSGPLVVAGWLSQEASERLLQPQGGLERVFAEASRRGFKPVSLSGRLGATVRSTIARSETANVVGLRPGRGPRAAEAVILGAHYDHLGYGPAVDGDSLYNGAEDNASGTAALLAAAEAFDRSGVTTGRSIVFLAFAAEESGLLGSTAFAARPTIPLAQLAAVFNMDVMNMYGRTRDIAALGVDQSTLGRMFSAAAAAENLKVVVSEEALIQGSFFRSDHFPLVRVGVPALSLQSGRNYVGRPEGWGRERSDEYDEQRYHQPSDELLPWFSYDGALQQLRVMLRTAVAVANAAAQPVWAAGSEFREAGEQRRRGP
jgi:Zn-dependent M28 family amino/carboxypeptidase